MTKFFTFLALSSEERPWLIITIVALLTTFLVIGISMLKTEFSQESMMPKHYESVQALKTVQGEFGGINYENILVVTDDMASPGISELLMGLSP